MNQSTDNSPTLLVWDEDGSPPKGNWLTVLWRSHGDDENLIYSMPRIVEEQADELRKRYLAWIYELGETQIQGKRLVDHLELRPGFSYWWMTLITEKCNAYKSFQIVDALKLLALENLVANHSVSKIILKSDNKTLSQSFRLWCKSAGLVFKWRPLKKRKASNSWIRNMYLFVPYPVQAIIFLGRYIRQRWPLTQRNKQQNTAESGEITFVDYLIHLNQAALTDGQFASNYWTDLVDIIDRDGAKVNWLHHYIQHEAINSTGQARKLIAQFNQNGIGREFHSCLDGALNIYVLLAVLHDYLHLAKMSWKLIKVKNNFHPVGSKLDLWPLFKRDWLNSMRGTTAIWNCLYLNLFERTFSRLPRQKLGVYLQENQAWEMAFIHAWRAAGHGCLIGVPHSTVRYWDLRYFFDSRHYRRTGKDDVPMPDKNAVNGPAAMAACRKGGYPEDRIVEVEALRYLYLADKSFIKADTDKPFTAPLRVLVFGDYLPAITKRQMQWLSEAALLLPSDTCFTVRSHPACCIEPSDYPSLHLHMTNGPLLESLTDCDVAFASNITSAAVDATCAGVPVVTMLDGNTLNMSPLRDLAGIVYANNAAELTDALRNIRSQKRVGAESYFCLDKSMMRWRKLLNLRPTCVTRLV